MLKAEKASKDDIPALISLLDILFSKEHEFTPDPEKQKTSLEIIISSPDTGCILIMKDGDNAVGMVSILNSVSTALGAKVGILEDMILHPDYQRKGYGKQLIIMHLIMQRKAGLNGLHS